MFWRIDLCLVWLCSVVVCAAIWFVDCVLLVVGML